MERTADPRRRDIWDAPDDSLIQPGSEGELIISHLRATVAIIAWGAALFAAYRDPFSETVRVYQLFTTVAAAACLGLHLAVKRVSYGWWLGFISSTVDVTLVSGGLLALMLSGVPGEALNSSALFAVYFFALAATTIRLDHRACFVAGMTAAGEYLLIVVFAGIRYGWAVSFLHLDAQLARMALLIGMAVLGVIVNRRMQAPHVLSANDSLTAVLNRRSFEERWESELARARRYGRPISVAVLDIDYFKQFNDRHGHAAGDAALVAVARALKSRVRATDFVGRMGGEEFAVALPETNSSAALALAEGLRHAVAEAPVIIPGSRVPANVTISVGTAGWPDHGEEITRLLDRADDRMYEAKLDGRNRVKGPSAPSNPLGTPIPY